MDAGLRRIEKRNRPPVSCEPCRTRKYARTPLSMSQVRCKLTSHIFRLKCNRALPCDACIRRDKSSLCTYAANASRSKPESSKQRDLKDRLNTLESLVSSFISGDTAILPRSPINAGSNIESTGSVVSSTDQLSNTGKLDTAPSSSSGREYALTPETPHLQETREGQVNYIDPSHWLSLLEGIKDVRDHLSMPTQPLSQNDTGPDVNQASDASFLFNLNQTSSLDEILSSLPSQPICDMLLSWYFNSRYMVLGKMIAILS
jgi:hypothetical protein